MGPQGVQAITSPCDSQLPPSLTTTIKPHAPRRRRPTPPGSSLRSTHTTTPGRANPALSRSRPTSSPPPQPSSTATPRLASQWPHRYARTWPRRRWRPPTTRTATLRRLFTASIRPSTRPSREAPRPRKTTAALRRPGFCRRPRRASGPGEGGGTAAATGDTPTRPAEQRRQAPVQAPAQAPGRVPAPAPAPAPAAISFGA